MINGISETALFHAVKNIIEDARKAASRNINTVMVYAYLLIGRRIIEHEQKGSKRADYARDLFKILALD